MDPQRYPAFIDDAMRRLPDIRSALFAFSRGGAAAHALEVPSAHLRSILYSADAFGFSEIADLTRPIIRELNSFNGSSSVSAGVETVLGMLNKLEAALLRGSLDDENFSLDIDDLIVASYDADELEIALEPEPVTESEAASFADAWASEGELAGFEVDDELLEIFAGEAEELLSNMETSLESLAKDPNDRNSLWEIRRNAHTFKGSAGIVGLKQLSELAHRVEDLLDRLAEVEGTSNPRIFELLRTSTDCLKELTGGETSPSLFHRISQLYYDFDGILANLSETQPIESEIEAVMIEPVEVAEVVSESAPVPAVTIPVPPALVSETLRAEKVFAAPLEERPHAKPAVSRSIVRVSLDRLDELVNIVRDMIMSRSVFEQRLKELERQIEELHNTTRRLQSTSGKLEVDFEASMLTSDRQSMFGSAMYGQGWSRQSGFDELEYDQYTDFHQSTRELAETASDTFAINTALDVLKGNFEVLFDEQRRLVEDLQEKLMRIRMVEFESLATRLQRAVRVTCEEENKKAEVVISNEKLEVDTQILDSLIEPLMHLLKNAVVHGIETPEVRRLVGKPETGRIEVSVTNEETHIVLTVADDGRGIVPSVIREKAVSSGLIDADTAEELSDEESLELIFLPGLTTAEKLNLSAGRGVGMSIVKESIQTQKGTIFIESEPQKGTLFSVRMPLALAITNVLLVRSGKQSYALPLKQIRHVAELNETNLNTSGKRTEFEIGGSRFPIVRLNEHISPSLPQADPLTGTNVLLVQTADRTYALAVDEVLRTEEIVIKSLGRPLDGIKGVLGAAILGNGELVPILDLPPLLKQKVKNKRAAAPEPEPEEVIVMVVDDSPSVRHLTSKVIAGAGWTVLTAKDGLDAIEQLNAAKTLPKVILSDIEMPRMDGYELAATLQRSAQFNTIPVVMITSRAADKHREKAYESGVSQYLTKPYDDRELIDAIKTLGRIT